MLKIAKQQLVDFAERLKKGIESHPWTGLIGLVFTSWVSYTLWVTSRAGRVGFSQRTLWDWMDLLIVPSVLAMGAWWLNRSTKATEISIASEARHQATLEAYFDRVCSLMLGKSLGEEPAEDRVMRLVGLLLRSQEDEPQSLDMPRMPKSSGQTQIRRIVRTRTLSALRSLDGTRRGYLLQFLHECELIVGSEAFVDLSKANLSDAQLEEACLSEADLKYAELKGASLKNAHLDRANLLGTEFQDANLEGVNLYDSTLKSAKLGGANLKKAILAGANLEGADLRGANLEGADLHGANLGGARVSHEQLAKAKSLEGATMPDGTKHD